MYVKNQSTVHKSALSKGQAWSRDRHINTEHTSTQSTVSGIGTQTQTDACIRSSKGTHVCARTLTYIVWCRHTPIYKAMSRAGTQLFSFNISHCALSNMVVFVNGAG